MNFCRLLPLALCCLPLAGCRAPQPAPPADEQIRWLAPGTTYRAGARGVWLVPDESMRLLLRRWAETSQR